MAKLIKGKKIAKDIEENLKKQVLKFKRKPKLAVILVGQDSASHIYVKMKKRVAQRIGVGVEVFIFDQNVSQENLIKKIYSLNQNKTIDGILVQLPLPESLDTKKIISCIDPEKDIDGFHPLNKGFLLNNQNKSQRFVPCTALGVLELIKKYTDIQGKKAVVVGRSNIVGKPIACLLLENNATVEICHSHTKNLKEQTKSADILVVAVGKKNFITSDMVKKGAVVIDVGINRIGKKLFGDLDFNKVKNKAGYITPVPGGVGPMTVIMLMKNVIKAKNLNQA